MNIQRTEIPHYTREQIVEQVLASLAIVDELELEAELRPVVLARVLEWSGAKQIIATPVGGPVALPPGLAL